MRSDSGALPSSTPRGEVPGSGSGIASVSERRLMRRAEALRWVVGAVALMALGSYIHYENERTRMFAQHAASEASDASSHASAAEDAAEEAKNAAEEAQSAAEEAQNAASAAEEAASHP